MRSASLLSIRTGGLSGPCVKPVALRMVWDVAHAVNIPVVGLGGISSAKDAIEFLMCGATAIEIGTANFIDPAVTKKVKDGINEWLDAHGCKSVTEIIGAIINDTLFNKVWFHTLTPCFRASSVLTH